MQDFSFIIFTSIIEFIVFFLHISHIFNTILVIISSKFSFQTSHPFMMMKTVYFRINIATILWIIFNIIPLKFLIQILFKICCITLCRFHSSLPYYNVYNYSPIQYFLLIVKHIILNMQDFRL